MGAHGDETFALEQSAFNHPLADYLMAAEPAVVDQHFVRVELNEHQAGLRTGSGTVVRLLASGSSHGGGDVVVALDTPYGLARSAATTARIAAYGRTSAVFASLMKVLTGAATAPGSLPVKVGSYPIGTGCPR